MRQAEGRRAISRDRYDAVLLDLDGVITDTASLHAACWKQMFDEYLQKRAAQRSEPYHPFNLLTDYRLYVDGKPRFDGVRDFLTSRDIKLPEDLPQAETVGGLGNRKNELIEKIIQDARLALMLLYRLTFTLTSPRPQAGLAQFHSPAVMARPAPKASPVASAVPTG